MPETFWILREDDGVELLDGPFEAYKDDEKLDQAMIRWLREHPWDDSPTYYLLVIGGNPPVEISELDEGYLSDLIEEAWGAEEPPQDG